MITLRTNSDRGAASLCRTTTRVSADIRASEGAGEIVNPPAIVDPAPPALWITDIQRHVCKHFNLTINELLNEGRLPELARPRQIGYWLCRELTSASYTNIGRLFSRHHSTAMYGKREIDNLIRRNLPWGKAALDLKHSIEAGTSA